MEIIIYDYYERRQTLIYGRRDLGGGKEEIIGYDSKNQCLEITTIDGVEAFIGNKKIKPLLVFPMGIKHELLNGLLNALSNINIKTEDENLLKGKLEATENHLNDMRDITKHVLKMNKVTNPDK
jgi:hypothetical protein